MVDLNKWIKRVDTVLDIQKILKQQYMSMTFTKEELIELRILLNYIEKQGERKCGQETI